MKIEGMVEGVTTAEAAARQHAKLVDAAQQFEGMMLQELLKPMQSSEGSWDDGDKEADESMETLSSYGTQAVATAISKGGGLGIAKTVVKQVGLERENDLKLRVS